MQSLSIEFGQNGSKATQLSGSPEEVLVFLLRHNIGF